MELRSSRENHSVPDDFDKLRSELDVKLALLALRAQNRGPHCIAGSGPEAVARQVPSQRFVPVTVSTGASPKVALRQGILGFVHRYAKKLIGD